MEETSIYQVAKRIMPETHDCKHYIEVLFKQSKEKEWFEPTNREDEAFSICYELNLMGLIAKRTIPLWNNSSFRGFKVQYLFVKSLEYGC